MTFKPCSLDEARSKRTKNSDIRKLLMQIIESGNACVEIKDFIHKDASSCAGALRVRIKKDRLKQLEVVTKDNRVFVINTLFVKDVK